jgi:hypothetical protein
MASQSTRMGLVIPTTADQFSTQDIANNWATIDKYPGTYICASTSRPNSGVGGAPVWSANQNGMRIRETDTGLEWLWTGSTFVRAAPLGRLAGTVNTGTITANTFSSGTTNPYVTAVSMSVNIPAGNRWIQLLTTWGLVQNSYGYSVIGFFVDGVEKYAIGVAGDSTAPSPGAQGSAGTLSRIMQVAPGIHTIGISFRTRALPPPNGGGTTTASNVTLDVIET